MYHIKLICVVNLCTVHVHCKCTKLTCVHTYMYLVNLCEYTCTCIVCEHIPN